jgi:hypothetical protein
MRENVQRDPATVDAVLADADRRAAAAGIDPDGRIRAALTRAISSRR